MCVVEDTLVIAESVKFRGYLHLFIYLFLFIFLALGVSFQTCCYHAVRNYINDLINECNVDIASIPVLLIVAFIRMKYQIN